MIPQVDKAETNTSTLGEFLSKFPNHDKPSRSYTKVTNNSTGNRQCESLPGDVRRFSSKMTDRSRFCKEWLSKNNKCEKQKNTESDVRDNLHSLSNNEQECRDESLLKCLSGEEDVSIKSILSMTSILEDQEEDFLISLDKKEDSSIKSKRSTKSSDSLKSKRSTKSFNSIKSKHSTKSSDPNPHQQVKLLDREDAVNNKVYDDLIDTYLQDIENEISALSFETGIHTVPYSPEREKRKNRIKNNPKTNIDINSWKKEEDAVNEVEAKSVCKTDPIKSSLENQIMKSPAIENTKCESSPTQESPSMATSIGGKKEDTKIDWSRVAVSAALNVMKSGGSDKLAELASTTVLLVCSGTNDAREAHKLIDEAASQASSKALKIEWKAKSAGLVGVAILRAGQMHISQEEEKEEDPLATATYLFLSCCSMKYI